MRRLYGLSLLSFTTWFLIEAAVLFGSRSEHLSVRENELVRAWRHPRVTDRTSLLSRMQRPTFEVAFWTRQIHGMLANLIFDRVAEYTQTRFYTRFAELNVHAETRLPSRYLSCLHPRMFISAGFGFWAITILQGPPVEGGQPTFMSVLLFRRNIG